MKLIDAVRILKAREKQLFKIKNNLMLLKHTGFKRCRVHSKRNYK